MAPGPVLRRLRPASTLALIAALALTVAVPPASGATASAPPDSHHQPLIDGCQRSNAMDLTLTTPEWVYVNRSDVLAARLAGDKNAGRKTVEGVVTDIHPAGDDLYVNHDYNDLDVEVQPDKRYASLAATGNDGENLGTEWEATLIPTWAWPQVGDRVRESGSWIWDCGHWGNGPADDTGGVSQLLPYDPEETVKDLTGQGSIRGEQTELHPLYQVATWRTDAADILQGVRGPGPNLQ